MKKFLTAQWRYLAMINYNIDPEVLAPYLPKDTELDSWQGETFVSMVGFLFLNTRLLGVSIPFHQNFEEVNLRFYVRRVTEEGEVRRGVVFIKEIVPRFWIAAVARLVYNEQYVAMPMRHQLDTYLNKLQTNGRVGYGWRYRGEWQSMELRTYGNPRPLAPGSEEEFTTEHYWGYARQRSGRTVEYRVEHPRWEVRQVSDIHFDCDIASLYGPVFAPYLSTQPRSAFVAEGSPVAVYRGRKIQGT